MSLGLLIASPLLFLFVENKLSFFKNIFRVLSGKISWVGRDPKKDKIFKGLKIGVLSPAMLAKKNTEDVATRERLNALYAKDFKLYNDLKLVMGNVFLLSRTLVLSSRLNSHFE